MEAILCGLVACLLELDSFQFFAAGHNRWGCFSENNPYVKQESLPSKFTGESRQQSLGKRSQPDQ
jgi:hypothetical protein